jgi:hypothetical protein
MLQISDVTFSLACNYQAPSYATLIVIQGQRVSIDRLKLKNNLLELGEHHNQLQVTSRCLHTPRGTRYAAPAGLKRASLTDVNTGSNNPKTW